MEPLKDCYKFSLKPKKFTIFTSCSSSLVSIYKGFSGNYNTRTTIIFLKKDYSETKYMYICRRGWGAKLKRSAANPTGGLSLTNDTLTNALLFI
jgi:hypothetical protein